MTSLWGVPLHGRPRGLEEEEEDIAHYGQCNGMGSRLAYRSTTWEQGLWGNSTRVIHPGREGG